MLFVPVLLLNCPPPSIPAHAGQVSQDSTSPSNVEGLFQKIDHFLKRPVAEQDMGELSLFMAQVLYPEVTPRKYLTELETIGAQLADTVRDRKGQEERLAAISDHLFGKLGFRLASSKEEADEPRWNTDHMWLHQLLSSRQGQCISLSLLYMSVAKRAGITLVPVVIPNHMFVRYSDGTTESNVEPTDRGRSHPDVYYERRFGVVRGDCYLRQQTTTEFIGALVSQLAIQLERKGRFEDSRKCHVRALLMYPGSPDIHMNYGVFLYSLGNPKEGLESIEKALGQFPRHKYALCNKGIVLIDLDRSKESLESFESALSIDDKCVPALAGKSVLLSLLKRNEEALDLCDRALKLEPGNVDALGHRAMILDALDRHEAALVAFDVALKAKPHSMRLWTAHGNCLARQKQFQKAIGSYDKSLAINPRFAKAHCGKAGALCELGRYDEALASAAAAVESDSADGRNWLVKGVVYYRRKEYAEALKCLETARKLGSPVPKKLLDQVRKLAESHE